MSKFVGLRSGIVTYRHTFIPAPVIRFVMSEQGQDSCEIDRVGQVEQLAESVGVDKAKASELATSLDVGVGDGYVDAGVPATVYATARVYAEPVKPDEVADAHGDIDTGRLVKDTRRLLSDAPLNVEVEATHTGFVDRYVDGLGASDDLRETAVRIVEKATETGFNSGKAPSSFAASTVYATARMLGVEDDVEQKQVADVADVSTQIIRRNYPDIIKFAGRHNLIGDGGAVTFDDLGSLTDYILTGIEGAVPEDVAQECKDMVEALDTNADWVRRCKPEAVAGGIVYTACKRYRLEISQREIADVVGVERHAVMERAQDIHAWNRRRILENKTYNELKEIASDVGLDMGMAPERDELINRLDNSGVEL